MASPYLNPHPAARERARQQAAEEGGAAPRADESPRNGSGTEPAPVPAPEPA